MPRGRERRDHPGRVPAPSDELGRRQFVPSGSDRRKLHNVATDVERDVASRLALSNFARRHRVVMRPSHYSNYTFFVSQSVLPSVCPMLSV